MKKNNIEVLEKLTKGSKKKPSLCKCKCHCGKIFETYNPTKVESCGCNRAKNKIGQRFNKLVIVNKTDSRKFGSIEWECLCDCGLLVKKTSDQLHDKSTCGCKIGYIKNNKKNIKDLTNEKFGKLTVLKRNENINKRKNRQVLWDCLCECGSIIERTSTELKNGRQDCGNHLKKGTKDSSGDKFNKITVVSPSDERYRGELFWNCICDCGTELKCLISYLRTGDKYSCGCVTRHISGENHYNYNKNLTDKERKLPKKRNTKFRRHVLNRDNNKCSNCDKTGLELVAHHINGYHWCKEGRRDIKNGIALCISCHNSFHKIYGNKNNTLFQLIEFMENWYDSSIEI